MLKEKRYPSHTNRAGKSTDFIPSNYNENNLLALLSPSMAYADDKKINPDKGIVEFNITPKDVKKITVSMITQMERSWEGHIQIHQISS